MHAYWLRTCAQLLLPLRLLLLAAVVSGVTTGNDVAQVSHSYLLLDLELGRSLASLAVAQQGSYYSASVGQLMLTCLWFAILSRLWSAV